MKNQYCPKYFISIFNRLNYFPNEVENFGHKKNNLCVSWCSLCVLCGLKIKIFNFNKFNVHTIWKDVRIDALKRRCVGSEVFPFTILIKNLFLALSFFTINLLFACQCPVIQWTKDLANQNDVILRVKILNTIPHQNDYLVAEAEVLNLFKGNPHKHYKILFPEKDECAVPVNTGEEWLIYGQQKQINSCVIDWCGLSRKKFTNDIEDYFIATHIITYDEELQQLLTLFPSLKINDTQLPPSFHKNIIPEKYELIIYLILSLIGFLIILQLIKKFLK